MKKPKLFDNFKNVIEKVKNMSEKDFEAWKFILIFFIVIDLFGVYWFLGMKTLGSALLLVLIAIFAFLLYFSGQNTNHNNGGSHKKMKPEEDLDVLDRKEPKENQEQDMFNLDLGISVEDYQKNIEKALQPF